MSDDSRSRSGLAVQVLDVVKREKGLAFFTDYLLRRFSREDVIAALDNSERRRLTLAQKADGGADADR